MGLLRSLFNKVGNAVQTGFKPSPKPALVFKDQNNALTTSYNTVKPKTQTVQPNPTYVQGGINMQGHPYAPKQSSLPYGPFQPEPRVQGATTSLPYGPVQPKVVAPTTLRQAAPKPIQPSSGSSAGSTGVSSNSGSQDAPTETINTPDPVAETQENLDAQMNEIFNPILENADSQINRLPSELSDLQRGVNTGAEASRNLIGRQLEGSMNVLGQQEANVRTETGKSLRNLAEDQRNILSSTARQLGARGAGDTSAGDYAGVAIGRQGLKQRGMALESQATGLREIEGRRFAAKNIADQENTRIEQSKQEQLTSLAQDFQNIQRQLENAKATATSDQRRYIADRQNELRQELSERLYKIQEDVQTRKAALADWNAKQEVLHRNALSLIKQKAAYDQSDVLGRLSKFGNLASNLGFQATKSGIDQIGADVMGEGYDPSMLMTKPLKEDKLDDDESIDSFLDA